MEKTTIRQAVNFVDVAGYLKRKDLKCNTNRNGVEAIYGTLTVLTTPNNEVAINVYVSETNSRGEPNKAYPGVKKIMNEWVSIASLMSDESNPMSLEDAKKACTKLTTRGQLSRREYVSQEDSSFVSRDSISSNFFSSVEEVEDPRATFTVECYIRSYKPEYRNGEPTGRDVVETWVPVYGGQILPFSFVVPKDMVDDFENLYSPGNTAMVNGDYIDTILTNVERTSGFGRANTTSTRIHELVLAGGDPPYAEGNPKAYSDEIIRAAELVRTTETIPAIEARANARPTASSTTGFSGNSSGFTF